MITLEVFENTNSETDTVELLRHIVNLIEEGYTLGFDPEWKLSNNSNSNNILDDEQSEIESDIILELADKIYSNVYPNIDDKRFYDKKLTEIFDWLCNGNSEEIENWTAESLVDEWKEYDQEEEVNDELDN
jgi:hypothetical protein